MIGQVLGGYRVTAKIGEGGMGVVYRAEHAIMGRQAVIKVLRPQLSSNRNMVKRFFNEARAAAAISHPGIVSVFDLGQREDGCAYIVMDFLQGESLGTRLRRLGRLESSEAIAIIRQMLSALSAAHGAGIVHRDLKPDNIFLVPDPELQGGQRIKLLDFGIAKLQDDSGPGVLTTKVGALMGTPAYMSPEQCRGESDCDQRADLYAVGVMLFELLTGKLPFVANTPAELMAAHMRDTPPRLRDRVSGMPEGLEEIVATLLAKNPNERYQSGAATLSQIDALAGGIYASRSDSNRTPSHITPHPSNMLTDPLARTASGETAPPQSQGTTLSDSASSLQVVPEPGRSRRKLWLGAAMGIALLAGVGTILSVGGSKDAEPSAAAKLADAAPQIAATQPTEALDAASVEVREHDTPLADGLPPIDFAVVSEEHNTKAKRLNVRGQRVLRDGDPEAAKRIFRKALDRDPGHLYSRYHYGGILASEGLVHEAVAILRQFKEKGCPRCLGRLQYARESEAWKNAWKDPAFEAITTGVRVMKPMVTESATILASAVSSGDFSATNALIAPRQVVLITVAPEGCKRKSCRDTKKYQGVESLSSVLSGFEPKYGASIHVGEQKRCSDSCCVFETKAGTEVQLRKLCTQLDTAGVRSLSSLDFLVKPPSPKPVIDADDPGSMLED